MLFDELPKSQVITKNNFTGGDHFKMTLDGIKKTPEVSTNNSLLFDEMI